VLAGMMDASIFFDLHRLPELFCGFPRRPGEAPTLYPVACAPQAWASGCCISFAASVSRSRCVCSRTKAGVFEAILAAISSASQHS
jgi:glycogen debranching enzyme